MRVVLDTNILVSTFLFGGQVRFIAHMLIQRRIIPCFSPTTWKELERVLRYQHLAAALKKENMPVQEFLARLASQSLFFPAGKSPVAIPKDTSDEAFLSCALSAKAEVIVTGDHHLLMLPKSFPIPILAPRAFKKYLSE